MKLKDIKNKTKGRKNPVAKNLNINKPSTHKDKKKSLQNPRKYKKHKVTDYLNESFKILCENEQIWTAEKIREKLETNDRWLKRAIIAIWKRQTEDEQQSRDTSHYNNVGFSAFDADFLSSLAEQILSSGTLSSKQIDIARKKMLKYSKQLAKIANNKI